MVAELTCLLCSSHFLCGELAIWFTHRVCFRDSCDLHELKVLVQRVVLVDGALSNVC